MDLVIWDSEFTAWEGSMARGWSGPGEHRELVQIGAVRLRLPGLAEQGAFEALIRPRINPLLSDYFVALTGITNARLAGEGDDLLAVWPRFRAFCGDAPSFCYGRDDKVAAANFRLYGVAEPPVPPSEDLGPWLMAAGLDVRGLHACDLAQAAGLASPGRAHDALADARAIAAAMRALVAQGARPPSLGREG